MNHNFQIGDLVRVRDWDDMSVEYGPHNNSTFIQTPGNIFYIQNMKKFCGNVYVIDSFSVDENYYLRDESGKLLNTSDSDFRFNDAMLEPAQPVSAAEPTVSFSDLFSEV